MTFKLTTVLQQVRFLYRTQVQRCVLWMSTYFEEIYPPICDRFSQLCPPTFYPPHRLRNMVHLMLIKRFCSKSHGISCWWTISETFLRSGCHHVYVSRPCGKQLGGIFCTLVTSEKCRASYMWCIYRKCYSKETTAHHMLQLLTDTFIFKDSQEVM